MDDIFIGRAAEWRRFLRDVFCCSASERGYCYSLVGPNGIGKTYLITHLAEHLAKKPIPNVYYFDTRIYTGMTYWEYWTALLRRFSRVITEERLRAAPNPDPFYVDAILDTYDFFCDPANADRMDTPGFCQDAIGYLNSIFRDLTAVGVRVILTIDEFDLASGFADGAFFQRLFELSPKGMVRLSLSVVTISRRCVSTIAHGMQDGSNLEEAYPTVSLKGFSNRELEEYFETYRDLPCGIPDEQTRREILYLCGRSPGLLMRMRHELELCEGVPDIGQIYREYGAFLKTAFDRMIDLMREEFVDRTRQQDILSVFLQAFIGPVTDPDFKEKLPVLHHHGFTTLSDGASNIFVLSGQRRAVETAERIDEPLSPYLVDYVRQVELPHELTGLAGLLSRTELALRALILREMKEKYPDDWRARIDGYAPRKDHYLDGLRELVLQNDFGGTEEITKLNVLSFTDYFQILRDHGIYERYFTSFGPPEALAAVMRRLSDCRNSSAHLNLHILSRENRALLREDCERILRLVEGEERPSEGEERPSKGEASSSKGEESSSKAEESSSKGMDGGMVGQTVTMREIQVTVRGGLRGIVGEEGGSAAISPSFLKNNGLLAEDYAGGALRVRLIRWDGNARCYNAEPI